MAPMDDAEKRLERVMDRLLDHRSAAPHPTPPPPATAATSTAGRSDSIMHSTVGSVNRAKARAESQGGSRSTLHLVSTSSGSVPLCRPWDRGDLFRRLATFKSMNWFGKPQVVNPVSCARRGWVNVDVDMIACDGCGVRQSFSIPASWSKQQVESTAKEFARKLETGHRSLCPWKGNSCVEGLANFPPTASDVLVQDYNERCEALLSLSALPLITAAAIDQMKLLRSTQLDALLVPSQGIGASNLYGMWDNEAGADCVKELHEEDHAYHQARRLIGLCGWELKLLPYSVFCDGTGEKVCPADVAQERDTLASKVSVCVKGEPIRQSAFCTAESKLMWDPSSALLECKLCGANVGLWNFTKMVRPSPAICAIAKGQLESSMKDLEIPPSHIHTSSGSDAWSGGDPNEISKDVCEVSMSLNPSPCLKGALDLSLTIAGGPPPTQLIYPPSVMATYIPVPGFQLVGRHFESSQMGDWVTSQKSREPQDHGHDVTLGECSVSRQDSRLLQTDSVNGVVVDNDGDENDIGVSGKVASELWKYKLAEDTSAVDQTSPVTVVEEGNYAMADCPSKRTNQESSNKESNVQATTLMETRVSSSVNAANVLHSKMTNSADSVEYLPKGKDEVEIGASYKMKQQTSKDGSERQVDSHPSKEGMDVDLNNALFNANVNSHSDAKGRTYKAEVEDEVDWTAISYRRLPSVAVEMEPVEDFLDMHGQQNGSEIHKVQVDTQGDSNEAFISHMPDCVAFGKAVILQGKPEEQPPVKKQEKDHGMQKDIDGMAVGLGVNGKTGALDHTDAEGPENAKGSQRPLDEYFAGSLARVAEVQDKRIVWDTETGSFDPVMHHHHFCPWVNMNAAAGTLCGWQLVLDALHALRVKEPTSAERMHSESTAPKFRDNPLISIRSLLRGSSFK